MIAFLNLISKAGLVFKFGQILWNSAKLYRFAKNFGKVAGDVINERRLPKSKETQEFLYASAELLRSGIVDFPGVDEKDLAGKLEQLALEMDAAA